MADRCTFKPYWWYSLITDNYSRCCYYDGSVNYFSNKFPQTNNIPCRCVQDIPPKFQIGTDRLPRHTKQRWFIYKNM